MISSPNRHDLVFPKVRICSTKKEKKDRICIFCLTSSIYVCSCYQGGWENDETVYEAACREALEEAGVRGILHVGSLIFSCSLCRRFIFFYSLLISASILDRS